jgi:acetyl esterase
MLYAVAFAAFAALVLGYLCITPRGLVGPAMGFVLRLSAALDRKKAVPREPAARRAKNDSDCALAGRRVGGVSARDLEIEGPAGSVALRLYRKEGSEPSRVLLFFHGGGWVLGDKEASDPIARSLCAATGALVVSTDYRLAPEHPFPAAIEDVMAAYVWVLGEVASGSMPSGGLFVAGDSAGGNLAAVLCLEARERGFAAPAGQLLFYPVADISRMDTPSYALYGADYMLSREDMEWFASSYVPEAARRSDPRVSPLLAPELRGLPPALVVTAEFDALRDEGEAYAGRLRAAGVRVELRRFRGMVHGFLSMGRFLPRAARRVARLASAFIRGA